MKYLIRLSGKRARGTVVGVVLAGGLSRRMNLQPAGGEPTRADAQPRDKFLLEVGGVPLLARVIARARPQVGALLLNANGAAERLGRFGLPVWNDAVPGYAGPLAGVLTGMAWARETQPGSAWLATFAADTPFFPSDVVERLRETSERRTADVAFAASKGRHHPVFALWPLDLEPDLRQALQAGERKIDRFAAGYRVAKVDFPAVPRDPFFNVNTPDDLALAERLAADEAAQPRS